MKDDITEINDAQITTKIPSRVKIEMETLVKKGVFNSLSECVRTAINRLLREIGDYMEEEKKKQEEAEKEAEMEELKRFVEEVGELYK